MAAPCLLGIWPVWPDPRVRMEIHPEAWARVETSRAQIEAIVARYAEKWAKEDGRPMLEYGVTTGFSEFKNVPIAPHSLEELQRNRRLGREGWV